MPHPNVESIEKRHEEFDPKKAGNANAKDVQKLHSDRGALLLEVDRLNSNFDAGIALLDNFLNHNARIMQQDHSLEIRAIADKLRGLK